MGKIKLVAAGLAVVILLVVVIGRLGFPGRKDSNENSLSEKNVNSEKLKKSSPRKEVVSAREKNTETAQKDRITHDSPEKLSLLKEKNVNNPENKTSDSVQSTDDKNAETKSESAPKEIKLDQFDNPITDKNNEAETGHPKEIKLDKFDTPVTEKETHSKPSGPPKIPLDENDNPIVDKKGNPFLKAEK
jgi:hypothetical protein